MIGPWLRHRLRSGRRFRTCLEELESSQRWTAEELQRYREEKLRSVVRLSYLHVPFYRRLFDEQKLRPSDITTIADLQKLPLLEKETVQRNLGLMRNRSWRLPVFRAYTGGTTGRPGVYLRGLRDINYENAALWLQYRWAGKPMGSRRIILTGRHVVPHSQQVPPFWTRDRSSNELILSSFHLSPRTLPAYVEKIREFAPFDMRAYPSTAQVLAWFCLERGISLPLSAVFTSSETLLPHQRSAIEKAFACRVFDWYGNGERVAAIAQCEHGTYHELPTYSIVEYLDAGGGMKEIVGTTLHNRVMPLFRYRTGDLAHQIPAEQCVCGRPFPVVSGIQGRVKDQLLMEDGRRVTPIVGRIFKGLSGVREAQIIQSARDRIVVQIVVDGAGSTPEAEEIVERVHTDIGGRREILHVELVGSIAREENGKFKAVKCLLADTHEGESAPGSVEEVRPA
jgi:phenylacetate-CoA ligase